MKLIPTQRDLNFYLLEWEVVRMWLDEKLSGVLRMSRVPISIPNLYPSLEASLNEVRIWDEEFTHLKSKEMLGPQTSVEDNIAQW